MPPRTLVLGSASPRRSELLAQVRLTHRVVIPVFDEASVREASLEGLFTALLEGKRASVRAQLEDGQEPLLVADTLVIGDDGPLGKPRDDDDAFSMLRSLAGRTHRVITGFLIEAGDSRHEELVATEVRFCGASDADLRAYIATGEGRDKAGAYGIQGIGGFLVESISGSYSNVVGLPLCQVLQALRSLGWWQADWAGGR